MKQPYEAPSLEIKQYEVNENFALDEGDILSGGVGEGEGGL